MKYLNGVLTVIAFCLIVITLKELNLFPEAKAGSLRNYVNVPLNPDGSLNVKIASSNGPMPVNLVEINAKKFPDYYGQANEQPAILTRSK